MEYLIKKSEHQTTDGKWLYHLKDLPQENNYIQIHNLFCSSDRKIINRARKILNNPTAQIKIVQQDW